MPLPFSIFPGFTVSRRALLCTLVDPTLRGVILSGPVGTGKSSLFHSFAEFTRNHVDPDIPFVQVPLGVTEDRLIGGIDIDIALSSGGRVLRTGLIAAADGGYLIVDDLPLLDELAATTVMQSLEMEALICEREGMSALLPSRFVLLATTVPVERDLGISAADRVAFLIGDQQRLSPNAVARMMALVERHQREPEVLAREVEEGERDLAAQVIAARVLHPLIPVGELAMREIIEHAERLNISGNRAEIFAMKAARAHAALRGSRSIESQDIEFAVVSVLAARAENVPGKGSEGHSEGKSEGTLEGDDKEEEESNGEGERQQQDQGEGDSPARDHGGSGQGGAKTEESEEQDQEQGNANEGGSAGSRSRGEKVLEAVDFNAPLDELTGFFHVRRSTTSGSGGSADQWQRGKHTRSISADTSGRRIALGATLRAAAPHQKRRRREDSRRVVVRGEDLKVKKFVERAGTLFIFCVDASGSMAMNRMREAKGAVTRLLQDAYVNRDSVALIAFRSSDAEVLLPPTSSVERAKRSLDVLPTGGGTPIASALMKAYALLQNQRRTGIEQSLVVLLTDGRANVPMSSNAAGMIMEVRRQHVREELDRIALLYRREKIPTLIIDTRQVYSPTSEAVRLAGILDARYYFLPKIDAQGIVEVVRG